MVSRGVIDHAVIFALPPRASVPAGRGAPRWSVR